ncbi:hypothetical protein ACTXJT_00560 [Corynebacterium casei]|uniref:hypothetical protein n=1 Tax=Corynebacterium casei TaxID=160386 RepID=UPI003FD1B995
MAYDSEAHRKLDELIEKVGDMQKLLERIADHVGLPKPRPSYVGLPRATKSDRKPYGF